MTVISNLKMGIKITKDSNVIIIKLYITAPMHNGKKKTDTQLTCIAYLLLFSLTLCFPRPEFDN